MKAITTKFHGPTATRQSKIVASDQDKNHITMSYSHALDTEANHQKAAEILREKMGWTGAMIGGSISGGMAFVFVE